MKILIPIRSTVPDGWIIDSENGLGVLIEVKDIKNNVSLKQLCSHLKRLTDFEESYLIVITPDLKQPREIDLLKSKNDCVSEVVWRSWNDIYICFKKYRDDIFIKLPKERFILDSMLEYLEQRREVLGFQGINFRKGFDVEEAKKILISEMEAIQDKVHEMYPILTGRRGAITTAFSKSAVWDCFGLPDGFNNDIHITVSINETHQDIGLTVPHQAGQRWKRLKAIFGNDEEEQALLEILKKLRKTVPDLFLEYIQRHFLHRRKGIRDAFLEFHIDTFGAPFRSNNSKTREFPIWYKVIKEAITEKNKINAQMTFKVRYYLSDTPNIDNESFLTSVLETFEALNPLYSFLTEI